MASFLGKINVVMIFGSGISQIVKPLQYMIKRMWNLSGMMIKKQDFCTNREATTEGPVVISPNFSKDFAL